MIRSLSPDRLRWFAGLAAICWIALAEPRAAGAQRLPFTVYSADEGLAADCAGAVHLPDKSIVAGAQDRTVESQVCREIVASPACRTSDIPLREVAKGPFSACIKAEDIPAVAS